MLEDEKAEVQRKRQLAEITRELYDAGVITATGGNLSIRCASRLSAAWITPSGIFKGGLRPEDMVLIDLEGEKLEGLYNPSVESVYHAGIFRSRPEIIAVVHTHAPLATVFGMCDLEMPPITSEAVFLTEMPIIPWYLGGSEELAAAVVEHIGKTETSGAFLRNHGLITVGRSLREAADATFAVEHTVKILLACKAGGLVPSLISEQGVRLLKRVSGGI